MHADDGLMSVEVKAAEDGTLNTVFFWVALAVIIFMLGRYSDTIESSVRRIFSSGDEDEIQALKLSGGDENSNESADSLGDKIKGFAKASKDKIKKTLSRGRDTIKGAAESMHSAAAEAR
mmetsp:Transcript_16359/g.22111  ORF Transcript_16359/g.22111 Transcript_16359/m.22111 type:complete len:120 (+) Transcript_16359:170-529(+)